MKKLLLLFSLLCASLAFGQGVVVAPQTAFKVVNGLTTPIANATITVCAANTGGKPCSPALANSVFSNSALTLPLTNPFTADSVGNYQFAIAPGNYTVTVTSLGFTGQSYQLTVATPITLAGGLGDPGANGVVFRNGLNTTRISASADIIALFSGACSVATFIRGDGSCAPAVATSSSFTGSPWLDFTSTVGGGVCDNATDDTAALNASLLLLHNQGGGTLIIPVGKICKITGQVTLPNDAGAPLAHQNPIRITSWANPSADNRGVAPTNGSGILNLTFNAANAKILSFGAGYLEIDHLTLTDTAADCATFFMTTGTTVNIHDNIFSGTASGATACNDAVIFGGTGTSLSNTVTSPFQGYFSHETRNYFNKMRRIALLQTYANGIEISFNHIADTSGTNLANGAAIESSGDVSNANVGNKFLYNLFEQSGSYVYSIKLTAHSNNNRIIGNDCYDPTAIVTLACVRIEAANSFNFVEDNFTGGATYLSDADGTTTYITSVQSSFSLFPQGILAKSMIRQNGANAGTWYDILNTVDSTETFEQLTGSGTTSHLDTLIKPAGGSQLNLLSLRRNGGAQGILDVGDGADTSALIRTQSSSADMKLETQGSGQVVWACGGAAQCKNQFNNNGQFTNSVSTGGVAPYVVTSTTPVANLSLSGVASTSQKAETGADASVVAFTPPALVGSYRIRFVLSLSAANTATLGWTAQWTDSNGNVQTPTNLALYQTGVAAPALTFTTSTAGNYYGYMDIDVNNAAATITVKLTFAGTSFTGKASANIERLQ